MSFIRQFAYERTYFIGILTKCFDLSNFYGSLGRLVRLVSFLGFRSVVDIADFSPSLEFEGPYLKKYKL